jgi:hypothetical protein
MLASVSQLSRDPFVRRWAASVLLPFLCLFFGGYAVAIGPLRFEGSGLVAFVIFIPAYVSAYFFGLTVLRARPWHQRIIVPPFGAILALSLMIAIPLGFFGLMSLIPHPVLAGLLLALFALPAAIAGGFVFGCCLWAAQYLLFGYPRETRWRWLAAHGLASAVAQYIVIAILIPLGFASVIATKAPSAGLPDILFLAVMAAAPVPHVIATGWLARREGPFHVASRRRTVVAIVASALALAVVVGAVARGAPLLWQVYLGRPPIVPTADAFEFPVAGQRYRIPVERVTNAPWRRSTRSFEHVRFKLRIEEFGLDATVILEDPRFLEYAVIRITKSRRLALKCERDFVPTIIVCWSHSSRRPSNRAIDFWNMPEDTDLDLVVDVPALGLRGPEMILLDENTRFLAALDRRYDYDRIILDHHGVVATISFSLRESGKMGSVVRRVRDLLDEMRR